MSTKYTLEEVRDMFESRGYSLVSSEYNGARSNVEYICSKHYDVVQKIMFTNFKSGKGCYYCGREKVADASRKYSKEDIVNHFKEKHCTLLIEDFTSVNTKVKYVCEYHPDKVQQTSICSFINSGHGCFYCGRDTTGIKRRGYNISTLSGMFSTYNLELISSEYKSTKQRLEFKCNIHPNVVQTTTVQSLKRANGHVCKLCNSSNGELKIFEYLTSNNYSFKREYSFSDCAHINKLRFDFAIFDTEGNLKYLIEYDGAQHFRKSAEFPSGDTFELTKLRDNIKNKYCYDNNIPLIRIPYFKYTKIESILDEGLLM